MTDRRGDFIETHSGKRFWPLDPHPEDVDMHDIAHALSHICRFNGHAKEFYSVAQHSILCAKAAIQLSEQRIALHCLLHDASEAYIADVGKPIKDCMPEYKAIEFCIQKAVYKHLKIELPDRLERIMIDFIDRSILAIEAKKLMSCKVWTPRWVYDLDISVTSDSPGAYAEPFMKALRMEGVGVGSTTPRLNPGVSSAEI